MAGLEENLKKLKWFNCCKSAHDNDPTFNPDSFLRSGELNVLLKGVNIDNDDVPNVIILFERDFDEGSAIHHIKVLFRLARKKLKILEHTVSRFVVNENDKPAEILSEEKCKELRKHVCELFDYIRRYFLSLPRKMKSLYDRLKVELLSELSTLYRCLPIMPYYADLYVQLSSKKDSYCLYHMYHLNLDVRWYYISLLAILKNYADSLNDVNESSSRFILESERVKETGLLEKQVQVLLSELISVALTRFKKIKTGNPYEENPFVCMCSKELWLLLQILCDSLSDARTGKSFWSQVNYFIDRVVAETPVPVSQNYSEEASEMETVKSCSDPTAFSLWMLLHLSYLYGYNHQGKFVGQKSGRAKSNYSQMEKTLMCFMNQNSQAVNESQIELQMRQYIGISSTICLERWWKPIRAEPVMIFWEYFHRRLNTSLLLPGASPAMLPILSKSVVGMLVQVKERLTEDRTGHEEDSFSIFLKFLGLYLMHCHKEEATLEGSGFRQWQQMRGRLYSKLGPTKVRGLSQLGLYRLISLFLTLSITADMKEVGKKMLDVMYLLCPWDSAGCDMPKRELILQAHVCLLYLHVQHEIDIAEIAKPLVAEVQEACNELAAISRLKPDSIFSDSRKVATSHLEGLRRLVSSFIEGIDEIIDSSLKMSLSEYTLIGPWISHWLKVCSTSATRRLMDTILPIFEKIQTLRQCISQENNHIGDFWEDKNAVALMDDGEETVLMKEQWNKMEAALVENVLPSVRSLCLEKDPPFQVADLAACFTLTALSGTGENFTQLFTYFAASDSVNSRIRRRYLCRLLPNEKFMKALSLQLVDYQNIIIQVWFRSCLLSLENCNNGELEELTEAVIKLENISQILSSQTSSSNCRLVSFEQFLRFIGEKYNSLQTMFERSQFRETCSVFFNKVDKVIGQQVRALSSPEIIMSIYRGCGLMALHCGNLIYTKGKPNCLLPFIINQLILPAHIYSPSAKLHKYILAAVKRSIIMYARGLAQLSPASDPYIKRCLREMLMHYIPLLYEKRHSCSSLPHPLLGCFDESNNENEILQNVLLDNLTTVFLTSREKQPHIHASKAIELIQEILEIVKRKSMSYEHRKELLKRVATRSLLGLFDFLLGIDETSEEWNMAFNLINSIALALKEIGTLGRFPSEIMEGDNDLKMSSIDIFVGDTRKYDGKTSESDVWKEVLSSVTQKFCQQHMAFSASAVFRVMQHLIRFSPEIVKLSLCSLEEEVKNVELRRGVGYDPVLRNSIEKIRSSLETAMKPNLKLSR